MPLPEPRCLERRPDEVLLFTGPVSPSDHTDLAKVFLSASTVMIDAWCYRVVFFTSKREAISEYHVHKPRRAEMTVRISRLGKPGFEFRAPRQKRRGRSALHLVNEPLEFDKS